MADEFLGQLLGNAARARVLRVFTFNYGGPMTLTHIRKHAGVNSRTASKEIRALEKIGVIRRGKISIMLSGGKRASAGKQKEYAWELYQGHKHTAALSKFVHAVSPVRHAKIMDALKSSGRLIAVILSGTFVGDDTRPADLIVVADGLNEKRLEAAVRALEPKFGREIRYAAFQAPEFRYRLTIHDRLLRDILDYPHLILLDKKGLL
ncbi:MAG: helix-turn-helix domain-containing protein [Patescibacteria group bacterium]|nr:helix-turn-helix domain-containing protein [Patescibacteria group bacterium]